MPSTMEPRTNNPGLGHYIGRSFIVFCFLFITFFFTAVHFYYATSALLDLVALLILFSFLFFLGMSLFSLTLCATVGPGELPSRFTGARMETFIRDELQRIVEKARARHGDSNAASIKSAGIHSSGAGAAAAGKLYSPITAATHKPNAAQASPSDAAAPPRLAYLDDDDDRQLANVASTAALTLRASPSTEAVEQEKLAMAARLRVQGERVPVHHSGDDDEDGEADGENDGARQRRSRMQQHGDDVEQNAGGSAHDEDDNEDEGQELPAYMSEMMQLRRYRKMRRGLEVVRVSEAAQKVLQAIDGEDLDRKQEEMSYLIPGANWCRFCNFYQMDETRHCTICCRCVYRSKAHCVCCGQCVGYANSKYLVLFLFYVILAFIMANFLDIYCVNSGYTFFFKPTGESNAIYYLVFVYSYAYAVICGLVLGQYLHAAGRNVGVLTHALRQQREELQSMRLRNSGESYQLIMAERTAACFDEGHSSPDQGTEPFSFRRAMDTVGEGLGFPFWFWPIPTRPRVKETDDPEGFWTNLKEAIRIRLRSVADEDDAFTDEDVEEGQQQHSSQQHQDGVVDERVHRYMSAPAAAPAVGAVAPLTQPPQAVAAAVQPARQAPAQAFLPASVPHRAKSTDVTVMPVAVTVPAVSAPVEEADIDAASDSEEEDAEVRPAILVPAAARVAPPPATKSPPLPVPKAKSD